MDWQESASRQDPGTGLSPFETGCEYVVDAYGCDPDALRELDVLAGLCEQIIQDLELQVVGSPQWHQFPEPGGVTGLYLLSESHLACHTYPELCFASFNLYCCRSRSDWAWDEMLSKRLGAKQVELRCLPRGQQLAEGGE